MFGRILAGLALAAWPGIAVAQQPRVDTTHAARDTLTRPPVTLGAVTITATPAVRYDPSSSVRIAPSVIHEAPATDAYELLRQTAGLEVHEQGQGPGFASDASIRGFSSDHSTDIALWVDGVPVNEPVNGHAEGYSDWNLLFPEAISSVEVLKGPTSVLYGDFAMAGVVNVTTLERLSDTRFAVSGGSADHAESSLLTGVDRPDLGAVFGIRGVHENGWRPRGDYDLGQLHGRWVQNVSAVTAVDAGIELYGTRWDSPGFLTDSEFRLRAYDAVTNPTDGGFKRRAQERVSVRVFAGPSLLWRSTAYATQGRWQLFLTIPAEPGAGEGSGSQTEEEDRRYGFGATSALTWALPRGEVSLGLEGRWDHADFQDWFTTSRRRDSAQALVAARQASGAAFLDATMDLTPHLRASLGARYDLHDTFSAPEGLPSAGAAKGVWSPKLGLLLHIPGIGALYASASRGFRETDGVITDPTLPFITEWAYEVGAKVDLGRLSASAALFRMDVSDEQTFDPVTLKSTSGGASRRQGVEVAGRLAPLGWLTLSADWTFNDARYLHLVTATDTLDGARVFNTARYVGVAAVEIAPRGRRWHVRIATNAVGPYSPFDAPRVVLSPYALAHIDVGVALPGNSTFDLGIRNLFDRAYPELQAGTFVSPGQPRSVDATLRTAL